MAKVKFKFGTWLQYSNLSTKDESTLYFITDKYLLFKGSTLYGNVTNAVTSTDALTAMFTVTKADGTTETVTVPTSAGLTAAIATHAAVTGSNDNKGHVQLSDSIVSQSVGSSSGIAATPKAVYDALEAAKLYADGILAPNDAMVFKGTIGSSGSGATVTALPTEGYNVGWTYKVIIAGTYAGYVCEAGDLIIAVKGHTLGTASQDSDWCVAQTNIDGAVTAVSTLTADAVMIGNGNKTVKTLANGTEGQILKMAKNGNSVIVPTWVTPDSTIDPNNILGAVPVAKGGTGANTAAGARTNLGLGAAAEKGVALTITSGGTDLPTAGAVYAALESATQSEAPEWEQLT